MRGKVITTLDQHRELQEIAKECSQMGNSLIDRLTYLQREAMAAVKKYESEYMDRMRTAENILHKKGVMQERLKPPAHLVIDIQSNAVFVCPHDHTNSDVQSLHADDRVANFIRKMGFQPNGRP